ncbi:MAG TPA: N-6 DNA methylase, partial [Actinomycetales bacterium]|nr:N-6 DNA methylase [Actinomycetales bacterium]
MAGRQGTTMGQFADDVRGFGASCQQRLTVTGDPEAAIRTPIEHLLEAAATMLGKALVPHSESRLDELQVRPDFAMRVDGAICGYVEVKRPGAALDPDGFTGHNRRQWERLRELPNLLYTNGTHWRLYRDGELLGDPVDLEGDLRTAGASLDGDVAGLERLLRDFLQWRPVPIRSVQPLVRAVAPLCRLLRQEVVDQLARERAAERAGSRGARPFSDLAADWRALLFPTADDDTFADGYAQAVTFSLLLARSQGIDVSSGDLHAVGQQLGTEHSLMGRALQLLTDQVSETFRVSLDLLARVVGAVDWTAIRSRRADAYLHLYEHFLEEYDDDLRKASGSYYTPREVVDEMVRLVGDVLRDRLGHDEEFLSDAVTTVDPAMGTGTFLHAILTRAGEQAVLSDGPGAAGSVVAGLAARLIGFELQMGPFAVAELRASDLLHSFDASVPSGGLPLFVTNTLDDPEVERTQLGNTYAAIAQSRRRADRIKSRTPVTVVIGNPPYRERAEGQGGWVEAGREGEGKAPLDHFRADGNGRYEYVLKNLYVYFWRWGTWKVFDSVPDDSAGVVCFITTAGYLRGPGFKGMREYLRRTCSAGWIIDASPEGHQPEVATRLFPGVQQPLAVGIFLREPGA